MGERINKLAIFDFSRTLAGGKGVYPGMVDQLQELKANGWVLAIASLSDETEISQELDQEFTDEGKPMTSLFGQHVYGTRGLRLLNEGKAIKHSKETVDGILEATNADPRKTIVVGDAFTEWLMAKNGRLKYLHAGWDDPEATGLSMVVDNPEVGLREKDYITARSKSIPRVGQLADRIEAELAPKHEHAPAEQGPER